jgi:hypothetical protein
MAGNGTIFIPYIKLHYIFPWTLQQAKVSQAKTEEKWMLVTYYHSLFMGSSGGRKCSRIFFF